MASWDDPMQEPREWWTRLSRWLRWHLLKRGRRYTDTDQGRKEAP